MHFISGRRGQFLAPKSSFFYATPILSRFFGVRKIRLNGIISPPYPEVTLDNFGFLVGNCLAAWWAIFQPSCRILAIFGNSEVLTLDVCCGKNMSSPEFCRSQVLSMGSLLNILSDITQIFLGTSGNQPFSQIYPFLRQISLENQMKNMHSEYFFMIFFAFPHQFICYTLNIFHI